MKSYCTTGLAALAAASLGATTASAQGSSKTHVYKITCTIGNSDGVFSSGPITVTGTRDETQPRITEIRERFEYHAKQAGYEGLFLCRSPTVDSLAEGDLAKRLHDATQIGGTIRPYGQERLITVQAAKLPKGWQDKPVGTAKNAPVKSGSTTASGTPQGVIIIEDAKPTMRSPAETQKIVLQEQRDDAARRAKTMAAAVKENAKAKEMLAKLLEKERKRGRSQ